MEARGRSRAYPRSTLEVRKWRVSPTCVRAAIRGLHAVRVLDFAALHPGYRARESESAPAKTTVAQCFRGFLPIRQGIGHSVPCFFQACRRRGIVLERTGSGVCPADLGFRRAARFLPLTMGWTDARGCAIGDFPPLRCREICKLFQMVTGRRSGLAGSPDGGQKAPL
jgi:hypothetical protein